MIDGAPLPTAQTFTSTGGSSVPIAPAAKPTKQQIIVEATEIGLKLLPGIVQGVETLFGKKTGQTKKQAAVQLFNTAVTGAAAGLGMAGDDDSAQLVGAFGPLASAAIDEIVAKMFPEHAAQ